MNKKQKVSAEAARRLRKVKAAILAEPRLYDQDRYVGPDNPCNSACCLAGWAIWMENPKRFENMAKGEDERDFPLEAEESLLLPLGSGANLFGLGEAWIGDFGDRYVSARTRGKAAEIAAERIEHFIKTGE